MEALAAKDKVVGLKQVLQGCGFRQGAARSIWPATPIPG